MFERLRSAVQAATNEYREYPKRLARRRQQRVESNLDVALSHLQEATGAETYDFVTNFLRRPDRNVIATFLHSISVLDVRLQLPFVQAVVLADKTFVIVPEIQRWARDNSNAVALGR